MKNEQEAYDIVQEVFLKLMNQSRRFQDEEQEKAWLLRVTINYCKDQLKSHWRKKNISWDEYQGGIEMNGYGSGNGTDDSLENQQTILSAIQNLPDIYKDVVYLYYYEEYSTEEIARLIHKNASTVRSRLQKARELLKRSLKEDWL